MIGAYLGWRPTPACLWHAIPRGVRGHALPPGNFENAYSQRCIFLYFGGKIKGIQDRLLSVVTDRCSYNCGLLCSAARTWRVIVNRWRSGRTRALVDLHRFCSGANRTSFSNVTWFLRTYPVSFSRLKKFHDTNGLRIIFLSFSRHYKAIIFQPAEIRNLAFIISHTWSMNTVGHWACKMDDAMQCEWCDRRT